MYFYQKWSLNGDGLLSGVVSECTFIRSGLSMGMVFYQQSLLKGSLLSAVVSHWRWSFIRSGL